MAITMINGTNLAQPPKQMSSRDGCALMLLDHAIVSLQAYGQLVASALANHDLQVEFSKHAQDLQRIRDNIFQSASNLVVVPSIVKPG